MTPRRTTALILIEPLLGEAPQGVGAGLVADSARADPADLGQPIDFHTQLVGATHLGQDAGPGVEQASDLVGKPVAISGRGGGCDSVGVVISVQQCPQGSGGVLVIAAACLVHTGLRLRAVFVVAFPGDPLGDLGRLAHPSFVMVGGKRVPLGPERD